MDLINGSTPGNLKKTDELSEVKIKRDGQSSLSSEVDDKLNPNLSILSKKENTRIENKSIVNNKPSQFKPILGVNFHNIKK
ncbi:MAG: hypothetical protein ACERLG_08590 [Sedimentibacter sp.]